MAIMELSKMNLSYLLNHQYYEDMNHSAFNRCNEALCTRTFTNSDQQIKILPGEQRFCLKTAYPGLLIGIGNPHAAGKKAGGEEEEGAEIKLGFSLDYVTGLPIIPGSTVKGVIRSSFKAPELSAYIAEKLEIDTESVKEVESAVFDDGKVVFFDAIPITADANGRLLGLDNITPHGDNPLKSPNPLTMLKVVPDVTFLFRFGFSRLKDVCGVTSDALLSVFSSILIDFGIGAKTNVGFGVMEEATLPDECFYLKAGRPTAAQKTATIAEPEKKKDGICQYEGCNEKTKMDKNGKFYPYCPKHSAMKNDTSKAARDLLKGVKKT